MISRNSRIMKPALANTHGPWLSFASTMIWPFVAAHWSIQKPFWRATIVFESKWKFSFGSSTGAIDLAFEILIYFLSRSYVTRAKDLKIRAGEWDTQTTKERLPYQERIVSRIFSHPNYNERSLANDVVSMISADRFVYLLLLEQQPQQTITNISLKSINLKR